jgi:hypothetical protein
MNTNMTAARGTNRELALVWDSDTIHDLLDILMPYPVLIRFSVTLSDGSVAYPKTVDQLLQLPKTTVAPITEIRAENEPRDKANADVRLHTQGGFCWQAN